MNRSNGQPPNPPGPPSRHTAVSIATAQNRRKIDPKRVQAWVDAAKTAQRVQAMPMAAASVQSRQKSTDTQLASTLGSFVRIDSDEARADSKQPAGRPDEYDKVEEQMVQRFKAIRPKNPKLTARDFDILVIGGGLAGLGAAEAIVDYNSMNPQNQFTFGVLEAHEFPGGRSGITICPEKGYLDMGGQYIGGTQNYLQSLITKYQLPTVPTYLPDDKSYYYELGGTGDILEVPGDNPFAFPGSAQAAVKLLSHFNVLAMEVLSNISDPAWCHSKVAQEYDQKTVAQAMDEILATPDFASMTEKMRRETRGAMTLAIRSAFSEEPENMSCFFFLLYAAAAGGTTQLFDVTGGPGTAEGTRFTYGVTSLVDAMVNNADPNAERIFCGRKVTKIAHRKDSVLVTSTALDGSDPVVCRARHVIVAMSPCIAKKIVFDPPLDKIDADLGPKRQRLMQESKMGNTIKAFLSYKTPFWRSRGLMGKIFSMYEHSIAEWSLDNGWTPDSNNFDLEVPAPKFAYPLMIFITGDKARASKANDTIEARKERILVQLTKIFGEDARNQLVTEVDNYCEYDYSTDPYADGCPTSIFPPGLLSTCGDALRTPIGLIHWAGTETATEWIGYMNGAIQSGFRTAHECISAMTPPPAVPK